MYVLNLAYNHSWVRLLALKYAIMYVLIVSIIMLMLAYSVTVSLEAEE